MSEQFQRPFTDEEKALRAATGEDRRLLSGPDLTPQSNLWLGSGNPPYEPPHLPNPPVDGLRDMLKPNPPLSPSHSPERK